MDSFPFNNSTMQRYSDYESYFSKDSVLGYEIDKIQLALNVYQMRCNVRLKGTGNSHYRLYKCDNQPCCFELRMNLSSIGWKVTRFMHHNCSRSFSTISKPLKVKQLVELLKIPTGLHVETIAPKLINNCLQDQNLLHPDINSGNKYTLSSRVLNAMKVSSKFKGVKGITDFTRRFIKLDDDNTMEVFTKHGKYFRSQAIFGSVKRLLSHPKCTKIIDFDGTHLKKSHGILLGICVSDSNNQWHLLSLSHETREECTEIWDLFYAFIQKHIPSIFDTQNKFLSDRDGGIQYLFNQLGTNSKNHERIAASYSICAMHLKRNVYHFMQANTKTKRQAINKIIDPLLYTESTQLFEKLYAKLKKNNYRLFEYFQKANPNKFCKAFSSRSANMTNNSIESAWSWLLDIRKYDSVCMIYLKPILKYLTRLKMH